MTALDELLGLLLGPSDKLEGPALLKCAMRITAGELKEIQTLVDYMSKHKAPPSFIKFKEGWPILSQSSAVYDNLDKLIDKFADVDSSTLSIIKEFTR